MNSTDSEHVGKVFVVVRGMRRYLICERVFTPMEAAYHAATRCYPPLGTDCAMHAVLH
jgi:hypothetical protein